MLWQDLPIFLNNRNRLTTTKKMVEWLLDIGCRNLQIIDNDSSYPPLLSWYEIISPKVQVHMLGENLGPWAFWNLELHLDQNTPFIVSDSDLLPSEFCPPDLIQRMVSVLVNNPDCGKVGAGLRVDSLPAHYSRRKLVFEWESQFWHRPFQRGLFFAPVDTTFAIYPPGAECRMTPQNIRLGYPYLLEHAPWLVNDVVLDSEEAYYRAHAKEEFIHWGSRADNPKIERIRQAVSVTERPVVLHLGCGNEYIPGWKNIDVGGRRLDFQFDLDSCRLQKLPILDNSVDGFYLCHALEHIGDTLALMNELYRVARHGAKFFARLPYGTSNDAWEDPTHTRPWFEGSFLYFAQPAYSRADYGYSGDWQCETVTLVVSQEILSKGDIYVQEVVKSSRNIVQEMVVELHAVKPSRPRRLDLLSPGKVIYTSDSRLEPKFARCL